MDYTVIGYTLLIGLIVIPFHRGVANWWQYPVIHTGIAFVILEMLRLHAKKSWKILDFIRTFYPFIGLSFAWAELDSLITIMFSYWANDFVVNLDKIIFGVHPTVWVQNIFSPLLTEVMNFFYASYYFFIPVGSMTLYFKGRKKDTLDFMFLVFLSYFTSFVLFLFFPCEGAWVVLKHLHTIDPEGGFFLKLNQFMQANGSIRGGAFPSSHVSGAFIVTWATFRFQKKLGFVLLPLAIGIALSTTYCRYHHAVDFIAGAVLGTILYFVGTAIIKKRDSRIALKHG